jgi:hypothetical protein
LDETRFSRTCTPLDESFIGSSCMNGMIEVLRHQDG